MTGRRRASRGVAAAATLVLVACLHAGPARAAHRPTAHPHGATTYSTGIDIPPRRQWNENFGYCGEVSFIAAGLHDGQYLSQYDARAIASPGTPQSRATSQLLLGDNDASAARRMRLRYLRWRPRPGSSSAAFLTWVKAQVIEGHPVAIGVFTNESRFYDSTDRDAGDAAYDYIVVVTKVTSQHPLTLPATYHPTDTLTFNDNGFWTGTPDGRPPYRFTYSFGSFPANRRRANAPGGDIYSIAAAGPDHAIALPGIVDGDRETVPVRVTTNVNREIPQIKNGSSARPKATRLRLTVTVSGLRVGETYNLYRYDSLGRVPTRAFNARTGAAARRWTFTASGPTHTVTQSILSSDEAAYRAVPISAP